jgi:hypothetical protein
MFCLTALNAQLFRVPWTTVLRAGNMRDVIQHPLTMMRDYRVLHFIRYEVLPRVLSCFVKHPNADDRKLMDTCAAASRKISLTSCLAGVSALPKGALGAGRVGRIRPLCESLSPIFYRDVADDISCAGTSLHRPRSYLED